MPYADRFQLADDYLGYTDTVIANVPEAYIRARYTGFVAVTAVTVYELAVKDIFIEFAEKKHKVLGSVTNSIFLRLNGRIKKSDLVGTHIARFGDKYVKRFNKKIDRLEIDVLKADGKSVIQSYNNMVVWRHKFVHQGDLPQTATYDEVKESYGLGKKLIECLAETMVR